MIFYLQAIRYFALANQFREAGGKPAKAIINIQKMDDCVI